MLRAVPMSHVRIQVPNRDASAATRAIAAEGLLHLVDIGHGKVGGGAVDGAGDLHAAFRDLASRIRTLAERLELRIPEPSGSLESEDVDFAAEKERIALALEPVERRVQTFLREWSQLRERAARMREILDNAGVLRDAGIDLARILPLRFAALRFGRGTQAAIDMLAGLLTPAPFALIPLHQDGGHVMFAAAVPREMSTRLAEFFRTCLVEHIALPDRAAEWDVDAVRRQLAADATAEASLKESVAHEKDVSADLLTNLAHRAELAALLLKAHTHFAAAGRFVVISGWAPAEAAARLAERVRAATGGRAIIDIEPAEHLGSAAMLGIPILHRNPLVLRPFQKLVELYGTPSYGEVQPTAYFAISFLLMFGLMFGDAGHGAVLFSAGWFLFRYITRFLDYGILLMEAGVSSVVFGVLYGSVFGVHGWIPVLWLDPIAELSRFMVVAIGLGVIVVSAGLVLNIVNSWRTGELREAVYGPKGMGATLLYWVVLVVIARVMVPESVRVTTPAIFLMLAAAVVVLAAGPQFVKLVEMHRHRRAPAVVQAAPWWLRALEVSVELIDTLFSFFANTVSFVRVAAFAAVHAGVFIAVFALADTMADTRLGGALSLVVHVAGNVVIILLEGLTVSVQVLRLEYYEFFGKFFRGGGTPYAPLAVVHPIVEQRRHRHA